MTARDAKTIDELIAMLDRTERHIVTFYYVERLTVDEIAIVLDLAPDAIRRQLRSIRQRVRDALTGTSSRAVNTSPADSIGVRAT